MSRKVSLLKYRLMRKVILIAVAGLWLMMLGACSWHSKPGPLGRMSEKDRNRTIVLDRSDEDVRIDERRSVNETERTHMLYPWTWF